MPGVPGTSKKNPLASPMYSGGTSQQDSKDNMGRPDGPKSGKSVPDPIGYNVNKNKGGK